MQNHTEETVGVLKQLKDEMTADLDHDGDGKLNSERSLMTWKARLHSETSL